MMMEHNPFAQQFHLAKELYDKELQQYQEIQAAALAAGRMHRTPPPDIRVLINTEGVPDARRYNAPTGHGLGEVAAFIPDTGEVGEEALIYLLYFFLTFMPVQLSSETSCQPSLLASFRINLRQINDLHPSYHQPLCFPLLFPKGGEGWKHGIPRQQPTRGRRMEVVEAGGRRATVTAFVDGRRGC